MKRILTITKFYTQLGSQQLIRWIGVALFITVIAHFQISLILAEQYNGKVQANTWDFVLSMFLNYKVTFIFLIPMFLVLILPLAQIGSNEQMIMIRTRSAFHLWWAKFLAMVIHAFAFLLLVNLILFSLGLWKLDWGSEWSQLAESPLSSRFLNPQLKDFSVYQVFLMQQSLFLLALLLFGLLELLFFARFQTSPYFGFLVSMAISILMFGIVSVPEVKFLANYLPAFNTHINFIPSTTGQEWAPDQTGWLSYPWKLVLWIIFLIPLCFLAQFLYKKRELI